MSYPKITRHWMPIEGRPPVEYFRIAIKIPTGFIYRAVLPIHLRAALAGH